MSAIDTASRGGEVKGPPPELRMFLLARRLRGAYSIDPLALSYYSFRVLECCTIAWEEEEARQRKRQKAAARQRRGRG